MRLVTFERKTGELLSGAFTDDDSRIIDFAAAFNDTGTPPPVTICSVLGIIEGGDNALDQIHDAIKRAPASAIVERAEVRLRAPIQPPPQMRDFSCFELHLKQSFAAARKYRAMAAKDDPEKAERIMNDTSVEDIVLDTVRRQPIYYKANRFAAHGGDDDVIWPSYSKAMDFELEWGCYIKKPAKDIAKEKAQDFIFGYSIFNDFSARDAQMQEMSGQLGPAKSKDFDTANPLGPCLVTADEVPDPYDLTMVARVNGEEWGRGNTGDMLWRFEDVIAYVSRSETLHPGEFLGSGTVGNGSGVEHMKRLKPGDVVELEVEKLGILRNKIVKPEQLFW